MYDIDYDELRVCYSDTDPYLRLTDVMFVLHISYRQARKFIDSEGLKAYKWGGRWHVHRADFIAWCEQKKRSPRRKRGFKLPTDDPYFGYK